MIHLVQLLLAATRALVRRRSDLVLENLALRQQVAVLAASGRRPSITAVDRWFWLALRRRWLRWTEVLVFVKPETVVRWHRAGFRRYWTWLSQRGRRGRPRKGESLRALIRRMATENAGWGAPKIHGELLSRGTCPASPRARTRPRVGSPSCVTIGAQSQPWTSSSYQR